MQLSPQQIEVLRWVREDKGSLNLIARAGCGKTTTLLEVVQVITDNKLGNVFLGAYNKAIAQEIATKLKARSIDWRDAEAGTLHSIGFRLWRKANRDVTVDADKVGNIIANKASDDERSIYAAAASTIRQAVSLAKQSGFGWLTEVDDRTAWFELFDHFGINDLDDGIAIAAVIEAAIDVLRASYAQDREVVDFDDMIAAPIVHNVPVRYPYDFVLIDEAQDTNAARRSLALKLLKPRTGRLIAVGDDRQAIYGFTGADSDAMNLLKRELGSKTLPLNVTYRCPKAIVAEAQRYVPDITAHPTAPQGVVRSEALNAEIAWQPTDAILCRNTKPLIEMAYALIGKKVACRVEGRDIGTSLIKLARRWKVKQLSALLTKLDEYLERETTKWLAKGREEKAAAAEDKVESLRVLIDSCQREGKQTVDELCAVIDGMFGDTPNGEPARVLTLSTVHKSKGREWDRVFILRKAEFMPSPWARKDWQQAQEANLIYVAITRAKQELVYLG